MKKLIRNILFSTSRYLIFFFALIFAFISAFLVFTSGEEKIIENLLESFTGASNTILYLLALSVIYTLVYGVWRAVTFSMPLKNILEASDKIKNGDFSARIQTSSTKTRKDEFDLIIDNFNAMASELESIETLKTDFISNVSHEIKTPLTIIQNQCVMIQSGTLSEGEMHEAIQSIQQNSLKLSGMITNILRLNKLENQEIFLAPTEFDICEQLRMAIIDFEPVWEEKNIEPILDIPNILMVKSDKELLNLVWHNLLSNAFKYTDSGSVTVSLRKNEDKVSVTIKDTGCGFDEVEKHRIFDKFYQSDTSHKSDGNGLGLALVKRISDIIGGEVTVSSEEGKGSTFTLTF